MKKFSGVIAFLLLFSFIGTISIAYADDDDDDDDYDDDEYYDDTELRVTNTDVSNWYLWSRDTPSLKGEVPFTEPKNVTLQSSKSGQPLHFYAIPKHGEIFVPGKAVSTYVKADAQFYSTSRILEVTTEEIELIFRAGTNVVYENVMKTPLPADAFYLNEDVYIPISVIANGLGFSVEWDDNDEIFHLLEMTHYE